MCDFPFFKQFREKCLWCLADEEEFGLRVKFRDGLGEVVLAVDSVRKSVLRNSIELQRRTRTAIYLHQLLRDTHNADPMSKLARMLQA